MRFVDPKNDVAFKKIFGSEGHTDILISFLNAVLDLTGDREIQEIEILNPYQAPSIDSLKYTLLDIQAKDKRGVHFIVEMQVEYVAAFTKRFLYYAAKTYIRQIDRGEDYPQLNQVIFIGILDYKAFPGTNYLTRHLILNTATGQQELRDIEFNFIELPKFTKSEAELTTVLEKWIYFIQHASDLDVIPASADFPALRSAYTAANRFGWSKEDLEAYENRGIKIQDERGALQVAEERGQQKAQRAVAQNMLAQGVDWATITKLTGITPDVLGDADEPPATNGS